ncbi:MAG: NTP transferase domain-containing protein [Candidatus Limnocylindrales bacterium]
MTDPAKTAAVVLAAGRALRFGSIKLLATLGERPILQLVLDTVAATAFGEVVVVLGAAVDEIEAAITWRGERRVRNERPADGLASSLRLGLEAVAPDISAALIVLGDQPLLRPDVVRALLAAKVAADTIAVVPDYTDGGGANPVLLLRAGFRLAAGLVGDHGLGPLLEADAARVIRVPVGGSNPDVDTPADLAHLVEADWGARVVANRDQVDRLREVPDGPDFYGPISSLFRADPERTDDPVLDLLLAETRPDETWLDVGAGAGRYALPIARRVREVIALDPSSGMLAALDEIATEHAIANARSITARWPMPDPPEADVVLIAHVGYDIEAIGPFVDGLEHAARRLCLAVLMEQQPASTIYPFWPPVHGEERIELPALPAFLALLRARGATPKVSYLPRPPMRYGSFDEVLAFARRQTWVLPDGPKDRRLVTLLRERAIPTDDGWTLPSPDMRLGTVRWEPKRPENR